MSHSGHSTTPASRVPECMGPVSECHVQSPGSHLLAQRLATGSPGAPSQCEGRHSQDHDQEDPSGDGSAVIAPLGTGLLLHTSRWQVWGREKSPHQDEPVEKERGTGKGGGPRAA